MSKPILDVLMGHIARNQARGFDPVRFAYIESLASRLEQKMYTNNTVLIEKLKNSVTSFKADFDVKSEQAKRIVESIVASFPHCENDAQNYFTQGQFTQLAKLNEVLKKESAQLESASLLTELNRKVHHNVTDLSRHNKAPSFDEILNLQELEFGTETIDDVAFQATPNDEPLEMQSMKAFRESMKYFNIDKIIDRAIDDLPANPGPHNPHMLAIKSLTQMRELSPQYLRRFAAYIETLLWLEKNAAKLSDVKKTL